jgi:hypothetical protein
MTPTVSIKLRTRLLWKMGPQLSIYQGDSWGTVTGDSSVSLPTYKLIVNSIYIFFLSTYIKSLCSRATVDQIKESLHWCAHSLVLAPQIPGRSARSKTLYMLGWGDIYGQQTWYISIKKDTGIAGHCIQLTLYTVHTAYSVAEWQSTLRITWHIVLLSRQRVAMNVVAFWPHYVGHRYT